ncbi:hypothetical protein F4803DRAFT_553635 [Xylaria telfairii]|nr:hypothetical protein F4803DRAFT_553635 [Xylaria telfairii]
MVSNTLALWLCNGFVICLILGVFGLRKWRKQRFTPGDVLLAMALSVNVLRMVGDYHINKYGTPLSYSVYLSTLPPAEADSLDFEVTPEEANGLVLTGQLLVPTRMALTFVIWNLNLVALNVLYETLLRKCENKQQLFWSMHTVMTLTWFVTTLSAFIECQPLELNWALLPDLVKCSYGTAWIMTYEISNITVYYTIGFILLFLLFNPRTPKRERVKLCTLGIWVVWGMVIMIRMIQGESFRDILYNRIVWGSVEVVFGTAVATLPIIYMLLRPGPNERQDDIGKEVHGISEASTTAIILDGDANHPGEWALERVVTCDNSGNWDAPIPAETTRFQNNAHGPMQRTPAWDSALNHSAETGARNSWQTLRDTFRHSLTASNASLAMQATEENLQDALARWIELEEMDPSSLAREASSPEPEDAGRVFVATEAHPVCEDERRPRIITIPPRAILNRS